MKTILRDGETMYRMRRIVQFSAVGRGIVEQLVVLCDDGSLWLAAPVGHPLSPTKWEQIPEPPPWSDAPLAEGGKVAAAPEQGQRDDGPTVHPATDTQRFDVLWRSLPFPIRQRYGGDEAEAREGVDALIAQPESIKKFAHARTLAELLPNGEV